MEKCSVSKQKLFWLGVTALVIANICIASCILERQSISLRFGDKEFIDHLVYPHPYREMRNGKIYWMS